MGGSRSHPKTDDPLLEMLRVLTGVCEKRVSNRRKQNVPPARGGRSVETQPLSFDDMRRAVCRPFALRGGPAQNTARSPGSAFLVCKGTLTGSCWMESAPPPLPFTLPKTGGGEGGSHAIPSSVGFCPLVAPSAALPPVCQGHWHIQGTGRPPGSQTPGRSPKALGEASAAPGSEAS